MAAVGAWFLGGPIDGRIMLVETSVDGRVPDAVRVPQSGLHLECGDAAVPTVEHLYLLLDEAEEPITYRYCSVIEHEA
jgi:hypothetical protein